jgi:ATP-binding cassette subfamily C protein
MPDMAIQAQSRTCAAGYRLLDIAQGTATVIIGLSGAGKTTLLDIISGLLVPDTGVVSVDGRPLDDGNRLAWCNSVAYVVQDAQLGNGTIRQNITRFAPDTS